MFIPECMSEVKSLRCDEQRCRALAMAILDGATCILRLGQRVSPLVANALGCRPSTEGSLRGGTSPHKLRVEGWRTPPPREYEGMENSLMDQLNFVCKISQ